MPKTSPRAERAPGSRMWRVVAIAGVAVLAICLAAALLWFFADPLHLPDQVLEVLDQRASVVGMFTGMAMGAAGLVVAAVALRAQLRAGQNPPAAGQSTAPAVPAAGGRAVALDGDNFGIISTGDGARNVQMRGQASGQGRVDQASGDHILDEVVDHRRTYGGDHIEFHHSTFPGQVVGKQVTGSEPAAPDQDHDGDDDRRR
ncbi:hypothetical protein MTP10_30965 [Nonomuraea sp. 3-1Str]|uniref:hypothetical protein n=1 Tax=Nonomuraea sp. 3-1Str TaxID=2929801 RepID=UPI002854BCBA|nr:hypothetical protein [Nonomuraea sp. 3-1Str]MDR8413141.1 hypothetical protein [Nonomuraea sp. 3-1Str]